MPYTDTNVSNLIINKMTQAEYDALSTVDENQIYLITDDNGGGSGVIDGVKIFYGTTYGLYDYYSVIVECSSSFTSSDLAPGTILVLNITNSTVIEDAISLTLNVNNTGDLPAYAPYRDSYQRIDNSELCFGSTYVFTYVEDVMAFGGQWIMIGGMDKDTTTSYSIPSVLCQTSASTAAKTTTYASYYTLRAGAHFEITMRYANSKAEALTLNVNSTGAKPIYINGAASSSTNYTLPAGKYIVYYDGTNYYFRTDGNLPGVPAVLSGTTAPSASDGLDGDIYIKYTV